MKAVTPTRWKDFVRPYNRTKLNNSQDVSVSIRVGYPDESRVGHFSLDHEYSATNVLAVAIEKELVRKFSDHLKACGGATSNWVMGVRSKPRIHPCDEQHLEFPTCAWASGDAERPEVARSVVSCFVESVGTDSPRQPHPLNHKHVFAYREGTL